MAMFKEQGCQVKPADFPPFCRDRREPLHRRVAERYGLGPRHCTPPRRDLRALPRHGPSRLKAFPGAVAFVRECRRPRPQNGHRLKRRLDQMWKRTSRHWLAAGRMDNPPVTAEDVVHRKPAPDIFLAAASKMGFQPDQCVVVEDAINGIEAARAAGMRCVAVAQTFPEHLLTQAESDPAVGGSTHRERSAGRLTGPAVAGVRLCRQTAKHPYSDLPSLVWL